MKTLLLFDIGFTIPHGRDAWIIKMNHFLSKKLVVKIYTTAEGREYYSKRAKHFEYIIFNDRYKFSGKLSYIIGYAKRNLLAILTLKRFNSVDIFYSLATLESVLIPFLYAVLKKAKWIVQLDNIVPLECDNNNVLIGISRWLFFRLSLNLIRKADLILCISQDLSNYLVQNGFDRNKLVLISNGIENNKIIKAKKLKNPLDLLFIGRINDSKGIFDMLRVIEIVKQSYSKITLTIVGDGDTNTKTRFINEINNLNLQENVKLVGYVTGQRKYNIIKSSKCFLFLSKSESESFGIALLEAVASGIPAFAYDLPAYKNIYQNGEVNIYKIGDYKSVASGIIKLLKSKKFYNARGRKLLGKYDWKNIAEIEYEAMRKAEIL